ncbi:hypothetical protein F0562_018753 [Nyssa sinensis]|uniref:NB-ARC domain-containing protein n=1 Tax=Nyssa sinensis TaxID=561372 RepID=A0A5J4ZD19_9ASTE|nr:hypothetical protein F0562_018753 [Nyssa sinensis]
MPPSDWRLHELTSLRELTLDVGCPDLVSFQELMLPTSLTSFSITELLNLETLSNGLQNLTSLEKLQIKHCPKIKFLPREELLAGLSVLIIRHCHMLEECREMEMGKRRGGGLTIAPDLQQGVCTNLI